jgi:hypothetical protein
MDSIQDTINRFRQNSPAVEVAEDFESRVFAKIKKKKRQRKVTASVTLGIALFGFLFLAGTILLEPPSKSQPAVTARTNTEIKEEVPVVEDVVFASSDSQSNYVIEQVSYSEDDTI